MFLAVVLRNTRLYWLPGTAMATYGMYLLATVNPDEGHGVPAVIGTGAGPLIAVVAMLYGIILLIGAYAAHRPRARKEVRPARQSDELPRARVVDRVSKS
jgi:hypothetical protein